MRLFSPANRAPKRANHVAARMLLLLLLTYSQDQDLQAGVSFSNEERLLLEIEPILVVGASSRSIGPHPLEIRPSTKGTLEIPIPWGPAEAPAKLCLEGTAPAGQSAAELDFRVEARLTLPGGAVVSADRSFQLTGGTSSLFEVFGSDDRRLVLSIRAERVVRLVARRPAGVGPHVLFTLAVERLDGARSIPLESDRLSTFVGESVEYSFHRAEGDAMESLRLVLTPIRLEGEIAVVEAEVTGSLPGPAGPVMVSRRDRLLTTRGATSSFTVTAATPPAGYRFRITPDF